MTVATLSSKGQIVIPSDVRRQASLRPGDKLIVDYVSASGTVTLTRARTLRQMSDRFTAWIDPDTPLPESASDYYATHRPARA